MAENRQNSPINFILALCAIASAAFAYYANQKADEANRIASEANRIAVDANRIASDSNRIISEGIHSDVRATLTYQNLDLHGCTDGVEFFLWYDVNAKLSLENKGGLATSITDIAFWGTRAPNIPNLWGLFNKSPGDFFNVAGRIDNVALPLVLQPGETIIIPIQNREYDGHWKSIDAAQHDFSTWTSLGYMKIIWNVNYGVDGRIQGETPFNGNFKFNDVNFNRNCYDFKLDTSAFY